ncbi:MAG: CcmD family protein [Gemmatimonadota bacterium]
MIPSIPTLLLVAALALPAFRTAGGDSESPASSPEPALIALQAEPSATQPAEGAPMGLPQRAPVARTMADFWPVYAGFVVTWLVIVAYFLSLGRRISGVAESMNDVARRTDQ